MKNDGRHCAVSSSGRQFCWEPGEAGTKVSGNEASTVSPQGAEVNPPPVPPKNNGSWQPGGSSTVTVTTGNTTNIYNVTNHQSSYGSSGSGGGAEGDPGNGGGSGPGGGEGEEGAGPGSPGAGLGDLYTPTDKTVSSVFAAFKTRVEGSPIVGAVTGFFTVSVSGSCPTFAVPASDYWEAMTFSAHCEGDFLTNLTYIGWVLLALACVWAARVALG